MAFIVDDIISAIVEMGTENVKDRLQRNERIVAIRKKLKLAAKPPDNQFATLYTYTLVEWGVFKHRQTLEFFRDEYVM